MRFDSDARQQTVDDEHDPRVDSAEAVDEPTDYRSEVSSDQVPSDEDEAVASAPVPGTEADRPDTETDATIGADAEPQTEPEWRTDAETQTDTESQTDAEWQTEPESYADAEPLPADASSDETAPAAADTTELMPGDLPAEHPVALWAEQTAQGFRERWRDVQLRFVDDPRGAAGEAQTLLAEVVDALSTAAARQKSELDAWSSADGGDTEQLRVVVRRYREFLDRVLGM